jgi:hypothetical protein
MKSPTSSRRRVRGATYLIGALALILAAYGGVTTFERRASLVHAAYAKDDGYFYRMTAKFEVKETGEKIDFDYVVACGIQAPRWKDETHFQSGRVTPHAMVKATADGHAVVVQTLEECGGFTSENGAIPPDVLPLAIWFDSADDLSNGLGYVSEDAYDNPLSKLRYHGTRIDPATRADWQAWRQKAAGEYVERAAWWGPWGYDFMGNRHDELGKYASACFGYQRLKLPDVIREKIRPLWPTERPRFWAPRNEDDLKISGLLGDTRPDWPPGGGPWVGRFGTPGTLYGVTWSGMPLRSALWVGKGSAASRWAAEAYPFIMPPLASAYPVTVAPVSGEAHVQKLEFRDGALNGFAACQNRRDIVGIARDDVVPTLKAKLHVFMVDNQVVRADQPRPGHDADVPAGSTIFLRPGFIFERDEYVFIVFKDDL